MTISKTPAILAFFFIVSMSCLLALDEPEPLAMVEVLDLKSDGVNALAFCSTSRQLFISHPSANTELNQWDIDKKVLLHTYNSPSSAGWYKVEISPNGKFLAAATGSAMNVAAKVVLIDTTTHQTQFTLEYKYPVSVTFDVTGKFLWVAPSWPGPDPFVYDLEGKKHREFEAKDFTAAGSAQLWDVPERKGEDRPGLFYKDSKDKIHRLDPNPLNRNYALAKNGKYIGTSTWEQRVRIWRTSDLKELFNEKIGAHPVFTVFDSARDQFLVVDGVDGNTQLRAIKLPVKISEHN